MDSKYKTLLESTVMFSSLTSDDMGIILSLSNQMKFNDGEKIFHIGDFSNQFFIVTEGEVTIRTGEDLGHQTDIARFLTGDSFGDLEFFMAEKRTASAIAVGETQLLGFPDEKTTLSEIMEKWPTISARLLHGFLVRISSRIRKANTFVKSNTLLVQELKRQVYVDKLTGLYNKVFFEETLGKLLKGESTIGLLFYKPDNFKKINDEYGHEAGDRVLEYIAGVLRKNVPDQDLLFRYAGNENVVILPGATRKSLQELAENTLKLLRSLDLSLILPGIDFSLSVSFGLTLYPDNSRDMMELVETSHALIMQGRSRGGNLILFPEDMNIS